MIKLLFFFHILKKIYLRNSKHINNKLLFNKSWAFHNTLKTSISFTLKYLEPTKYSFAVVSGGCE